ncbi:OPT/YSL family transporter [Parvibacter caecicola]|uniref:OPT/YSL family transporter n=2 Tax=Parvibacter caecicola TaxID=747645 RepID=UPI00248CBE92|nr:OPT/YSL family transporter [Parvibacter caecicola]
MDSFLASLRGQLTLRGCVIGLIGCIVITASSVYTALKLGALPWPIVFAAIISLFFLRALGSRSLNEANVTHTIMSSGAMVAGGLAFTIPGAWMLGLADEISIPEILVVTLGGVALGLVCTGLLRRYFIEEARLEFPMGIAAAETLKAGSAGGQVGKKLFGTMGLAGLYTALKNFVPGIPAIFLGNVSIPGVAFGIYNSPMMLAVGFLVGTGAVVAWFAGAVFANFGIVVGGTAAGLWTTEAAGGIVSSLGMGLMMGCGFTVILKNILPAGVRALRRTLAERRGNAAGADVEAAGAAGAAASNAVALEGEEPLVDQGASRCDGAGASAGSGVGACGGAAIHGGAAPTAAASAPRGVAGLAALLVAAAALALCLALGVHPLVSVAVVALTFVTTAMSAQSVGQTGIDPMEIFGLIVLLLVAAFSATAQAALFLIAAFVAVACGLAGDVMNDFKAGHVLGTSSAAQMTGQAIGAVVGSFVAVAVVVLLLGAYGPDAFGVGKEFVAAQASVVATMVSGVPSVEAFAIGIAAGMALQWAGLPAMMIGLGVYLPFYMSFTAFLGAMAKATFDAVQKRRQAGLSSDQRAQRQADAQETGLVVASGVLGGESIVGVILATLAVFAA